MVQAVSFVCQLVVLHHLDPRVVKLKSVEDLDLVRKCYLEQITVFDKPVSISF